MILQPKIATNGAKYWVGSTGTIFLQSSETKVTLKLRVSKNGVTKTRKWLCFSKTSGKLRVYYWTPRKGQTVVEELQKLPSKIWLHIFGLSAPAYAKAFHQLGVTSFDGASHFKEAFSAGSFFLASGEKLIKHKAVKPGEIPTAHLCNCLCCLTLRKAGIDTRRYGSNQNNKGRAIHNLNQLIIAQQNAISHKYCQS